MPAGDAHQIFAGAVVADLAADQFGDLDHEILGQQRTVVFRQIGHHGKVAQAPVVDPLPDLADPHLRLPLGRAGGDQRVVQLVAGQADKVHPSALGQVAGDRDDILGDRRVRRLWGHLGGHGAGPGVGKSLI